MKFAISSVTTDLIGQLYERSGILKRRRVSPEVAARLIERIGQSGEPAAAFHLFTGHTPDTARMLRHLDVLLAGRGDHHAA